MTDLCCLKVRKTYQRRKKVNVKKLTFNNFIENIKIYSKLYLHKKASRKNLGVYLQSEK